MSIGNPSGNCKIRGFEENAQKMMLVLDRLEVCIGTISDAFAPAIVPAVAENTTVGVLNKEPLSAYKSAMESYLGRITTACENIESICRRSEL